MTQCKKIISRPGSFLGSQCRKEVVAGSEFCVQHDPACRAKAKAKRGPSTFELQAAFRNEFEAWMRRVNPHGADRILQAAAVSYGSPAKEQIPDPKEFFHGS